LDPPATRGTRLAEAVTIIKGLFSRSPYSFSGDHYTVTDVAVFPPDRLPPTLRLMIGGANRRIALCSRLRALTLRVLSIALSAG
jgi:alkanesulfonate monooxygenase SsuD/methylene tetrahydromethanopterin reductase-like flavin-dependent oxidoreductase (luciferase family)